MLSSLVSVRSSSVHIFAGERLQAFSDAVFAIIATLMVIPLKLSPDEVKEKGGLGVYDLEHFIFDQWPRYLVYVFSFNLVVDMWYSHVGIFSIIEQVDDVIIWLNLLFLLLVSFLPFGTGLVSSFPASGNGESIAITICALNLLLAGICMLIILLYAFRQQSLLHPEIGKDQNIVAIRRASIISVLITPCISLLSLCFSFLEGIPSFSLIFFYSTWILSFLTRLCVYLYYKYKKKIVNLPCHLFNSVDSTTRTEAFSDGVFSIVATLIILDLTQETVPSPSTLTKDFDLRESLKEERNSIIAYVTSFIVVGLLWFVHYGMMHYVERLTPVLNVINNTTLFLVGGIPFVSGMHGIFADASERNSILLLSKSISIRSFCVLMFLISVYQLIFWTVAWCNKSSCLSESINEYGAEGLQLSKIMVFPIISLIIYAGTFSEDFIYYDGFSYVLFTTPFIFLLLKVIFRRNDLAWRKAKKIFCGLRNVQGDMKVNASPAERAALIRMKDSDVPAVPITRLSGKEGGILA